LRNREEQLRLITNSVPALIVFFDRDCRFRFANRTAERWYARSADSIQGETISEVLGVGNAERLKPHVERVLGGNADAFDATIDYPDGVTRHTHQTYTPRFDDDGTVTGFYAMVLDISDRVAAEQALKEKERQIDAILDHSPAEIILKDAEGRYVRVNRIFERDLNVRSDELVGKLPSDVYSDSLADFVRSHDLEVLESGEPVIREFSAEDAGNSDARTELVVKFPVFDAGGAVTGLGAIVSDISKRKRAEEALRRSEQQLRLISDSLPVLIIYFDSELRYRFVNRTAENWYARPRSAILGRTVHEVLGEATGGKLRPYFEKALQGVDGVYEEKIPYPDGVTRDVHAIYVSERGNGGEVTGFYVLVMDVTASRTAEALVRRSRTNLRKLAERLETAREEERRAVAYEIHDDIGQLLTALKLAVFEALPENAEFSPETSTNKELVSELFDKLFEKVRSLARRLRPGLLDELGLEESIVVQVEEMAGHMGWDYTCSIDMNGHQIPKTHETVIFRFVQEALTNVARHAQADHVDVVVDAGDEGITVQVIDDGRGISPVEVDSSDSLGLIGMRERAGSVGGR
ncbi:MAG: PAS domain-containing protein, partial [Rhodothermales bacterium]|nr:PAS domain-containing protein [Rhodothermales bacterium]